MTQVELDALVERARAKYASADLVIEELRESSQDDTVHDGLFDECVWVQAWVRVPVTVPASCGPVNVDADGRGV